MNLAVLCLNTGRYFCVRTRGFTMLELVMVIVIIGVIAAMAVPRFSDASTTARINATHATWNVFEKAMFLYEANYGEFPGTMREGEFESGLKDFIKAEDWERPPQIGGTWVFANTTTLGIGIKASPAPMAIWLKFDQLRDDGDLRSGRIQKRLDILMRHFDSEPLVEAAPDLEGEITIPSGK